MQRRRRRTERQLDSPADGATGGPASSNLTVTFREPVTLDTGAFTITCTSGLHSPAVSGGPTTFTLDPAADFSAGESCTVKVTATAVHDVDTTDPPDTMTADYSFSFTVAVPVTLTPIHTIQGAAHISPLAGQTVSTTGIVTAKTTNGFYLQDPNPDADPATSEAIFVFTSASPPEAIGDAVQVTGKVSEFRPAVEALTQTELGSLLSVAVISSGNPLPAPVLIGPGGRIPPQQTIEDDATGNVETSGTFDPSQDGLDFWEKPRVDADRDRRRGRRRPDELIRRDADRLERGRHSAHAARWDRAAERLQSGASSSPALRP